MRGYKQSIRVDITLPYLLRSENRGVGTIQFDQNFSQDTIQVLAENSGDTFLFGSYNEIRTASHGNGDIYLNGNCNRLYAYTFGTNVLNAENLIVNSYVFVENISVGNCYINAPINGALEYNIWRSGNIYYRGTPTKINSYSNGKGTGQLIKED